MSETGGGASAIGFENVSGGATKNGGMRYKKARNPAAATATTAIAVHFKILFTTAPRS
jgi:hypothetical protein